MKISDYSGSDASANPGGEGKKLPAASEYALIVGAGATAAASIAAQQVAVATLPVTTLVALGLLNRYRLDQRLQASKSQGPITTAPVARAAGAGVSVTAQPQPEATPLRPQAAAPNAIALSAVASSAGPRVSPPAYIYEPLARKLQAKADVEARQRASLAKVGAYLQRVRQEQALSVEDIHRQTFIQPYTLRAIEGGNLHQLPEPFYIRAFIQKYAAVLGLEGAALAADFPIA
jgi:hypothetical protein